MPTSIILSQQGLQHHQCPQRYKSQPVFIFSGNFFAEQEQLRIPHDFYAKHNRDTANIFGRMEFQTFSVYSISCESFLKMDSKEVFY